MRIKPIFFLAKAYVYAFVFLFVLPFSPLACYANEEIVATDRFKDAIITDSGAIDQKKQDAELELVKVSPSSSSAENADGLRISYCEMRYGGCFDKETKSHIKNSYQQKWTITLDTLEIHTMETKYKVYVDGVYKRDSIETEIEYRACGSMTLKCYDYKDSNKKPIGKPDELTYKGHSYFTITETFFNWLNDINVWPVVRTAEYDEDPFVDIYLAGPDSTFVATIGSKKLVANVTKDGMEVSLFESSGDVPAIKYLFLRDNKAYAVDRNTSEKGIYTCVYTENKEKTHYIEVRESDIVFVEGSLRIKLKVDGSKILAAINLAKIREILIDGIPNGGLFDFGL